MVKIWKYKHGNIFKTYYDDKNNFTEIFVMPFLLTKTMYLIHSNFLATYAPLSKYKEKCSKGYKCSTFILSQVRNETG